jgi:hypothetical protein
MAVFELYAKLRAGQSFNNCAGQFDNLFIYCHKYNEIIVPKLLRCCKGVLDSILRVYTYTIHMLNKEKYDIALVIPRSPRPEPKIPDEVFLTSAYLIADKVTTISYDLASEGLFEKIWSPEDILEKRLIDERAETEALRREHEAETAIEDFRSRLEQNTNVEEALLGESIGLKKTFSKREVKVGELAKPNVKNLGSRLNKKHTYFVLNEDPFEDSIEKLNVQNEQISKAARQRATEAMVGIGILSEFVNLQKIPIAGLPEVKNKARNFVYDFRQNIADLCRYIFNNPSLREPFIKSNPE